MFDYQNLEVYKKAFMANTAVYQLLKTTIALAPYIKNQLGRASLSILLNIAEGSAKFSKRDRKNFYVTARGSVFECSALIGFLYNENEISPELKNELFASYDEISRILFIMIKNLEGVSRHRED